MSSLAAEFLQANRVQAELRKENTSLKYQVAQLERDNELLKHGAQYGTRGIPDGFLPVEAYTDGNEVVVLGDPPDEEQFDDETAAAMHNCDALGCCTFSHVLIRVPHPHCPDQQDDANGKEGE